MPSLRRRSDGGFFVRHFYKDHNTWQILGDGVLYLERRSIREGDLFSTETFMELWMRGFVYYGDTPPNMPVATLPDTEAEVALHCRVKDFHKMWHAAQTELAWELVWQGASEPLTIDKFKQDVSVGGNCQLDRWKIVEIIQVYDLSADLRTNFDGARRAATVAVKIRLVDFDYREVKQWWLELNGQWRIWWSGSKLTGNF